MALLNGVVTEMVRLRAEKMRAGTLTEAERGDLLSQLLTIDADTGKTLLSESEIVDNIRTFLFAGHDTTSVFGARQPGDERGAANTGRCGRRRRSTDGAGCAGRAH